MRAARGRRDVPARGGRGGVARRRRARRHRRELPVHEAGGPRAAGRPAARPSPARHGGGRDRDQRLRCPACGTRRDGGPGGARRPARGARSDLRARAPRPAARRGRPHGRRDRRPRARARGGGIARALMNVGVVGNPSYRDLKSILAHLAQVAPRLGLTLFTEEHIAALWPEPAPAPLQGAPQLECLVTLGGDGTLLRGARSLNGARTPILGVNLGRVGFLTTANAQTLDWALDVLVRRAYATESRLALAPFILDKQGKSRPEPVVLNDAVVHKRGVARVIRLLVSFDGQVGTTMQSGERLVVKRSEQAVLLVRLGPEGFFARMRKKLQWGDLSDRERQ